MSRKVVYTSRPSSADILRDLTELVHEGHLHEHQDAPDGPFPRRRQPGRFVALPQAAGVHEVLRTATRRSGRGRQPRRA